MNRALVVIHSDADREKVCRWARNVPRGTRIEFKETKRTIDQNSLLWARLTEISNQVEWYGEKLSPSDWKTMMTAALRKERVVPGINGGFVVLGQSTSKMTKGEMSELLELIGAFAAERGVVFRFDQEAA